jgi:uncharacterized protein (TIGR00369 family)
VTESAHTASRHPWGTEPLPDPHIWTTLGYRNAGWEPGRVLIEWDATEDYTFAWGDGRVVHGGMVATLLDTAMGGACWTVMGEHEGFLTGDLRVEFFRSARPGLLRAEGRVVQRSKRVVFCAAELTDADGAAIAGARCTQIVLA